MKWGPPFGTRYCRRAAVLRSKAQGVYSRVPFIRGLASSSSPLIVLPSFLAFLRVRAARYVQGFETMGRGNSSGGGQSSLGYLFGGGEQEQPGIAKVATPSPPAENTPSPVEPAQTKPVNATNVPAGILGRNFNNYQRADGQNTGNFITDRPSTKVHAAPGGGSSLNYLFGGGAN